VIREVFVTLSALADTIANGGNIYQAGADDGEQFDRARNQTNTSLKRSLTARSAGRSRAGQSRRPQAAGRPSGQPLPGDLIQGEGAQLGEGILGEARRDGGPGTSVGSDLVEGGP
jgi:hypothetical protein